MYSQGWSVCHLLPNIFWGGGWWTRTIALWNLIWCFLSSLPSLEFLIIYFKRSHIIKTLYIYKLVLPEPANHQNEENKWFLHGLCSPPTGNTELLQDVQILLLSLRSERSHYHSPTSSERWQEISEREAFIPEVFGVSSSETAVFHNVVAQS